MTRSPEENRAFFFARYKELGFDAAKARLDLRPALRVNTLTTTHDAIVPRLEELGITLKRMPFTKHGYWIAESSFSLGAITEHFLGYYYLQEAAAQLPVEVLNPKPGETVLDCCAAPGGKTTQLAQWMGNKGIVVALERKPHRMMALLTNLERCGIENCLAYNVDAQVIEQRKLQFDKILLDAPCAGNFAGDQDWFAKRTMNGVRNSVAIQRRLLALCVKALKPGGVIVYSTCSIEPEENELNMAWLLERFDIELLPVKVGIGQPGLTRVFGKQLDLSMARCCRVWPGTTEGFFIAKVRRG